LTDLLGLLDIRNFFVIGVLGPTIDHSSTGPRLRALLDRLLAEANAFQWVLDKLKIYKENWTGKSDNPEELSESTGHALLTEDGVLISGQSLGKPVATNMFWAKGNTRIPMVPMAVCQIYTTTRCPIITPVQLPFPPIF